VGCWATTALLVLFLTLGVVLMLVLGEIPVTARLIDGGSLVQGGAQVEGGLIDVVLTDVPLSASWSYVLMMSAAGAAWAVLCVVLARISRGLRFGVPFRSVTPGFLYGLAAVWTGLSIVAPFVMAKAQPAGVSIPNATFAYTMAAEDVLSIVIGPVIAVIVAVLATGSRMWSEHRTLV
jgi:hypothetical protein